MTTSGSDVARRTSDGRSEGAGDGVVTPSTLSICDTATTARASWSASSGLKTGAGFDGSTKGTTLRGARIVDSCSSPAGRGRLTAPGACSAVAVAKDSEVEGMAATNGDPGRRGSRPRSQTKPPIAAIRPAAQ